MRSTMGYICTCESYMSEVADDHEEYCCLWYDPDFVTGQSEWDPESGELIGVWDTIAGDDEDDDVFEYHEHPDRVLDTDDIVRVVLMEMDGTKPDTEYLTKCRDYIGVDVVAVMEKLSNQATLTQEEIDLLESWGGVLHVLTNADTPPIYDCLCDNSAEVLLCGHCGVHRNGLDAKEPWVPTYVRRKREVAMWLTGELYQCTCDVKKLLICQPCNVQRWSINAAWSYMDKDDDTVFKWSSTTKKPIEIVKKAGSVYDWDAVTPGATGTFYKCRHYGQTVPLPDGTSIMCSSEHRPDKRDAPTPDIGCYMYDRWEPDWLSFMLPWTDYGLPKMNMTTVERYVDTLLEYARDGKIVEIGCMGGHGRTGSLLALILLKSGCDTAQQAIDYVHTNYCKEAIEGVKQEWYIACFEAYLKGEDAPPQPKDPCQEWKHRQLFRDGKRGTVCPDDPSCQYWVKDLEDWEKEQKKSPLPSVGYTTPKRKASSKKKDEDPTAYAWDQSVLAPVTWDTPVPEKETSKYTTESWCSMRRHFVMWWRHETCPCTYYASDIVRFKLDRTQAPETSPPIQGGDGKPGEVIDLVTGTSITPSDK